jgi:ketol-acid reductoisomerase
MGYIIHYGGHRFPVTTSHTQIRQLMASIDAAVHGAGTAVTITTTDGTLTLALGPGIAIAVEETTERTATAPAHETAKTVGGEDMDFLATQF